ncbi:MAG TPA: ATP-binding protein [Polyangiaceae bacterium]|nr:ATP-binding protein [Polyangiaceae bacterium]
MASADESAAVSAEAELASILESSRDLVIRYDRDIRIRFFNSAAARIYRELLGVELWIGLCTYDLFSPEQRVYWDGINARVLGGETFTEELTIPDQQGAQRTYEVDYHPTRRGSETVGFTTFARDVTAARAHEAAVREKHKLESIGVLAGGIAHDFNNLLAAMLGNIGLAQQDLLPDSPAARYLSSAEDAALRAADLTRQMLTYAGRAPALMQPVELGELVQQMVQLLRSSVPKNVVVTIEPGGGSTWVHGDVAQLQQVIMNLVTNGADAVGKRPGLVRVSVTRAFVDQRQKGEGGLSIDPGSYVALVVQDDGNGIAEHVRARMFDPFFTTKAAGRGLGLAAMLGILRNHRASIEVSSDVGKGTRFRVLIPEHAAPVATATPLRDSVVKLSGLVLLADDETAVLAMAGKMLESLGFDVIPTHDGVEACKRAEPVLSNLRMALLDLNMPAMGGLEAARALRLRRPVCRSC